MLFNFQQLRVVTRPMLFMKLGAGCLEEAHGIHVYEAVAGW